MRVEIPAYTDRWMMGDRYGEVVRMSRRGPRSYLDNVQVAYRPIATVRLDKSGKTISVLIDDCRVVD